MKTYLLGSCVVLMLLLASCYNQRENINYSTFSEPVNPEKKDIESWEATGRGLHLSFGSKDVKYAKGQVPMKAVTKEKQLTAWRGERVSFQAVLWSSYDVNQVECVWSDLVSSDGDTIGNDIIETHFVRYIMSDADFVSEEADEMTWRDSCLIPDMLDNLPCIDVESQSVRPLWVTIKVPRNVSKGSYNASLKVYSKENPPQELRVQLDVIDKELPASGEWRFQTNMCINPVTIAQWHKVELWSEEHVEQLTPYVELMKLAGQKNINVSIFNQYNTPTQLPLIKWKEISDGRLMADFTNFDKWVETLSELGVKEQIDCLAFRPEGVNTISYISGEGQIVNQSIDIYGDAVLIKNCYAQLIQHLKEKALFEKSVFVIGAGNSEDITFLKELIASVDAEIKLELVAHEWTSGIMQNVYAANVPSQFSNLKEWFKLRHQKGLETSYLLGAKDNYPNICLRSPSAQATWLGWYAASQGIDGIHVDQFNNWGNKPLVEARLPQASSGSSFLIYPDARSSIRYERLIEGIQDFEKLLILREQLSAVGEDKNAKNLELIDEVLSDFVIDRIPRESAKQMVTNGQLLINQIVNE
ncbi:DUF4091 domain-containing protein [Carboxylicivirga sp. A043]|uniref:DUF4091 domain-containing protein n=1 Tax=Carboxylicivirga litoralis TaxID=2816963 RepID=UPI0021CB5C77|nr:DUF4091 domain-containing protein [Carboxylicivirga sp. A043]MCU4156940.1 DUF4091 domain-containing protein [Carboxylicivirga sp. A043]